MKYLSFIISLLFATSVFSQKPGNIVPPSDCEGAQMVVGPDGKFHSVYQNVICNGGSQTIEWRYCSTDALMSTSTIPGCFTETTTTLVNNNDGTYTYTNEEGVEVIIGQEITVNQYISGDTIYTSVEGELGTIDDSFVTITNEVDTNLIDNTVYFITTTTDENGNQIIDTTGCKALPTGYIVSLVNDSYVIENGCDTLLISDIYSNDTPCTDVQTGQEVAGTYQIISVNEDSCFESLVLTPTGVEIFDCQSEPKLCSFDYEVTCPDGQKDTATVTIQTVPDPIGEIRLNKSNNAENNEVESGETFTYTYTICNDPNATGDITDIEFLDELDMTCFTNVAPEDFKDENGNIVGGTGYDQITGELTFDWAGPLVPGQCVSADVSVQVLKPSGFEFIPNIAYVEGNDGVNGPGSTSAYDIDVVNETEFAEALVSSDDSDPTSVLFTPAYTKQPSGALVSGEPIRNVLKGIEDDGSETVLAEWVGIEGQAANTTTEITSTNILNYLSGTNGNGSTFSFDLGAWMIGNGFNLDDYTDFKLCVFTGGQGSTTCPVESTNENNDTAFSISCNIMAASTFGSASTCTDPFPRSVTNNAVHDLPVQSWLIEQCNYQGTVVNSSPTKTFIFNETPITGDYNTLNETQQNSYTYKLYSDDGLCQSVQYHTSSLYAGSCPNADFAFSGGASTDTSTDGCWRNLSTNCTCGSRVTIQRGRDIDVPGQSTMGMMIFNRISTLDCPWTNYKMEVYVNGTHTFDVLEPGRYFFVPGETPVNVVEPGTTNQFTIPSNYIDGAFVKTGDVVEVRISFDTCNCANYSHNYQYTLT